MKKFLAIILFSIHLFNLGGYQFLFSFLERKSSTAIVERLDGGDFADNELVEVKIPYPLPYAANWSAFERYDGEIEVNGVHFNYVKRKMVNDTLVILCIPNTIKTELSAARSEWIAGFNSIQTESSSNQKSPAGSTVKPFTTECNSVSTEFVFGVQKVMELQEYFSMQPAVLSPVIQAPYQPPQV